MSQAADVFSPRTKGHVGILLPMLEHFGYTPTDIATLVRESGYEEQRIGEEVESILDGGTIVLTKAQKKKRKEEELLEAEKAKKIGPTEKAKKIGKKTIDHPKPGIK